jgi:hypothetical protein
MMLKITKPMPERIRINFCMYQALCSSRKYRHFRSLLAQFGLTPKSKRGLAAGDSGEAVDVAVELVTVKGAGQ